MRRNHSDAAGRSESSTELIARITAERQSRAAEATTRTATRTPDGATTGGVRTSRTDQGRTDSPAGPARADHAAVDQTVVRPARTGSTPTPSGGDVDRTLRTERSVRPTPARSGGRHQSPDAETEHETAVIDRVTQLVADRPVEAADVEQDRPDGEADPEHGDRDFYPAPGRPRRSRRGRPISRRLAPLAVGAAVMLVATSIATLVKPGDEDQVAAPELSGQVIADQTPPPSYLDNAAPTTQAPTPAPVVTPPPAPKPAAPAAPAAPKPAPKPTTDEGTQAAALKGWKPVGGDEFNGSGLSGQWGAYDGAGHDGKGRREPGKVSVQGGNLVIQGDGDGNTGGVSFKDGQKYGKWELRAKFPAGDKQYHPVLILWPDAENWPAGGEIDFAETNSAADDVSFFLHYNPSNSQVSANKNLDITQWHNYAIEWVDGRITGYIDGQKWFENTNGDTMPPGSMHPTIQLDYFPSGGDPKPSEMLIDYMRIYQ
jgi:hypothetical protein